MVIGIPGIGRRQLGTRGPVGAFRADVQAVRLPESGILMHHAPPDHGDRVHVPTSSIVSFTDPRACAIFVISAVSATLEPKI